MHIRSPSIKKAEMKDKIVVMCTRIHELEDALRKLESNASEKDGYSISDPKSLLDIEWQDDSVKELAPSEKDSPAEPLDEFRNKALVELEEAGFIGRRSVEVRTPVILFSLFLDGLHSPR